MSKLFEIVFPEACGHAGISGAAPATLEKKVPRVKMVKTTAVSAKPERKIFLVVILLCSHSARSRD